MLSISYYLLAICYKFKHSHWIKTELIVDTKITHRSITHNISIWLKILTAHNKMVHRPHENKLKWKALWLFELPNDPVKKTF